VPPFVGEIIVDVLLLPPPSPPLPTIKPLLTNFTVSPVAPPVSVSAGFALLSEYIYYVLLRVTVISDVPALYVPLVVFVRFVDANVVTSSVAAPVALAVMLIATTDRLAAP
jgi:hypothetical protein